VLGDLGGSIIVLFFLAPWRRVILASLGVLGGSI
jgi:hypothetical protein